jgi:hypothetical protein
MQQVIISLDESGGVGGNSRDALRYVFFAVFSPFDATVEAATERPSDSEALLVTRISRMILLLCEIFSSRLASLEIDVGEVERYVGVVAKVTFGFVVFFTSLTGMP